MGRVNQTRKGRGQGRNNARGGPAKGVKKGKIGDARFKLINKNRAKLTDARDKLAKLAKTTDARQKLQKIRNLKAGKLDEKKTKNGGITITKTTTGKILLTTKKKAEKKKNSNSALKKAVEAATQNTTTKRSKNFTRKINRDGGTMSINTKKNQDTFLKRNQGAQMPRGPRTAPNRRIIAKSIRNAVQYTYEDEDIADVSRLRRTIRQSPIRKTINEMPHRRIRDREREVEYEDELRVPRRKVYDYDTPRDEIVEYQRRIRDLEEMHPHPLSRGPRTIGDRLEAIGTSPLQGAKIIVSNLQSSVSQEDIIELFGDIGPLKRSRVSDDGVAEVVFVNLSDAKKAVEVYHNRQLDGKAMKCQVMNPRGSRPELENQQNFSSYIEPEIDSIHKALHKSSVHDINNVKTKFKITMSRNQQH